MKKAYGTRLEVEIIAGLKALKKRDGVPEAESIHRALVNYLKLKKVRTGAKGGK